MYLYGGASAAGTVDDVLVTYKPTFNGGKVTGNVTLPHGHFAWVGGLAVQPLEESHKPLGTAVTHTQEGPAAG